MGTLVDEKIKPVLDLFNRIEATGELPEGEPSEFMTFAEALPFALGDNGMVQDAAQPCYVEQEQFSGTYPGDEATPCPKTAQPAFNGRQAIYNSGVIPYEGVEGNTFRVKLSDDVPAGTYTYYCNVHGPLQYGQIEVLPPGSDIPSQAEVDRRALEEQRVVLAPMERSFNAATAGEVVEGGDPGSSFSIDAGQTRIVGVPTPSSRTTASSTASSTSSSPVASRPGWGRRHLDLRPWAHVELQRARVLPGLHRGPGRDEDLERPGRGAHRMARPPPARRGTGRWSRRRARAADARPGRRRTWDGTGFRSTGLAFNDQDTFSVRFSRPGTYAYACLIHPKMVGTLVVQG